MRLVGAGGSGTSLANATSELPLPLRQWCTLDIGCDGRQLWLTLDGRELAQGVAEGTPQQNDDSVFEVVPPEGGFEGAIDEVRWFVYAFSKEESFFTIFFISNKYIMTYHHNISMYFLKYRLFYKTTF